MPLPTRHAPTRRALLLTALPGLALLIPGLMPRMAFAAGLPVFYRNAGCGCCHTWTGHMEKAGMPVDLQDTDDMAAAAAKLGIPEALAGCHVGEIGGYAISGHVPPADIKRLLAEKPQARGLAVPGMPMGSPGMEAGGQSEPYEVLLFKADGSSERFAAYS
jgi:hypothetical protein